jgi:SAM-dependent methyltransferase
MQLIPDPIYSPENIPLFEAIYGKNLISLGGLEAIDNMFSDIDFSGLKVLDIGFGLGGVAFYLAKKYQIEIAGIELHQWMVEYTEAQTPKDLAHLLKFTTYNSEGNIPFENASRDLVYSKGVLNHVQDKSNLFLEINRVLKKEGMFVIADWIYLVRDSRNDASPLVKETQESYKQILLATGFTDIHFRDDSHIFLGFIKYLLANLTTSQEYIENQFGEEVFSTIWDDHQRLIEDINYKRKFAIRIKAKKK